MKKYLISILALVTFSSMFVSGCNNKESVKTTEVDELPVIKIALSFIDFQLDVIVAVEKGYFEEAGVKVELVQADSQSAIALVARGDVEGIFLDSPSILTVIQEEVKIKPVVGIGNREFAVITRKDSDISSFEDLDGKILSTQKFGGGPWFAAMCDIEEYGINPEVISISGADSIAALITGNIDAMVGGATNLSLYPDELQVLHLCHQSKYIWNSCSWCFSEQFLTNSPDLVEKFIAALTPAREYIHSDMLGALQILSKYSHINPEQMMKQNQLPVIPDFSIPPALYIQGLYKVNELMVKYGYLKAPIDIDAHIDTRFAVPIYEY